METGSASTTLHHPVAKYQPVCQSGSLDRWIAGLHYLLTRASTHIVLDLSRIANLNLPIITFRDMGSRTVLRRIIAAQGFGTIRNVLMSMELGGCGADQTG